jgi:iron-sulfur cluster repair protein YtfE (RIC family)
MNVIRGLAREHAAFTKLIERLEAGAAGDEKTARREVRNTLLILLSALDKHEKVEDVVFGNPSYASSEEAKRILEEVESQHQELQELRLEFLEAATSSDAVPMQRLKFLVSRMADGLRMHFKTEEERLWPHYENFSRSLDASIRSRIERSVKDLESDIAANSAEISDYLHARE